MRTSIAMRINDSVALCRPGAAGRESARSWEKTADGDRANARVSEDVLAVLKRIAQDGAVDVDA
ncbi:MAG: hypothetical protein R3D51_01995 [Hyphomicrobiaceae bacterium]